MPHITAALKKLIIILLLFSIVEKTTGLLSSNFNDLKIVLGVEDKSDDESKKEKKETLEFIQSNYYLSTKITGITSFPQFFIPVALAPTVDPHTPPPDRLSII